MSSLLNKKRDDKGTWHKVSDLRAGLEVAVPSDDGSMAWDEITSIKSVGKEQVYDIEVEGTHNFVGNDIFAHNTYVLKSGDLTANAPDEVLTADHAGVDLAKLATHTLANVQSLADQFAEEQTEMVALEARVEALETGAIGTSSTTSSFGAEALASALESFGAFIQNGIAQFNTLVFQRIVASSDSSGTSSAASVNILRGSTVAQVSNSLVIPSTKIFVTFNSQIVGSWWVSDKAEGSFRVVLSEAQTADVSFDYFLVQTEGQIMTPEGSQTSNADSGSLTSPDTTQPDTGDSTPPSEGSQTSSDTTPPVVTLNGDAAMQITVGDVFTDAGATALDPSTELGAGDTDLTASIVVTGSVDTATAGLYTLTYTATDAAGNAGAVSRVVTVVDSTTSTSSEQASSPQVEAPAPVAPETPPAETPPADAPPSDPPPTA